MKTKCHIRCDGTREICPQCDMEDVLRKDVELIGWEWVSVPCAKHARENLGRHFDFHHKASDLMLWENAIPMCHCVNNILAVALSMNNIICSFVSSNDSEYQHHLFCARELCDWYNSHATKKGQDIAKCFSCPMPKPKGWLVFVYYVYPWKIINCRRLEGSEENPERDERFLRPGPTELKVDVRGKWESHEIQEYQSSAWIY